MAVLKGVNKNIIEIVSTESDYFERAILFVRPESMDDNGEELHRKAKSYLSNLRLRPAMLRGKKRLWLCAIRTAGAVGAGAAAAILLIK